MQPGREGMVVEGCEVFDGIATVVTEQKAHWDAGLWDDAPPAVFFQLERFLHQPCLPLKASVTPLPTQIKTVLIAKDPVFKHMSLLGTVHVQTIPLFCYRIVV